MAKTIAELIKEYRNSKDIEEETEDFIKYKNGFIEIKGNVDYDQENDFWLSYGRQKINDNARKN